MECIVEELLPNALDNFDHICKCPICIQDIKTLTLNHLRPRYVCTNKGFLYEKANELSDQFKADILKEIVNAIEIVSKHPRHSKKL